MKVAVIGCGSIGRRHIENLIEIGHTVYAADKEPERVPDGTKILTEDDIDDIEVAFICTPTSAHLQGVKIWADKHLFVEKPLTDDYDHLMWIRKINRWRKGHEKTLQGPRLDMVACNLRFDPLIRKAKKILEGAKTYCVKCDYGYFLPYWRPGVHYKSVEHPGVVLDCVHELDLLRWLHGNVKDRMGLTKDVMLQERKPGIADAIIGFESGVIANLHLDYLRRNKRRRIEWITTKGTITYEQNRSLRNPEGHNRLLVEDRVVCEDRSGHDVPYVAQLEYFFRCIERGKETFNNIEYAAETTRLALILQHSAR